MDYILFCEDKADSEPLRLATREAHLTWARAQAHRIKLAGAMLSDDGEHMVGSMFVLETDSIEDVHALNREDPYTQAGLWGNVIVRPFRQAIPAPNA